MLAALFVYIFMLYFNVSILNDFSVIMCGRTACTLSKDHLQQACCVLDPNSKMFKQLDWDETDNGGKIYKPSFNLCPTDVSPVIMLKNNQRILKPMVWGMIPPWHKGKYNNHKLSTNNCRIESILESKMFKEPMICGKRCVVVCDGFYEWQTTTKERNPFFIYAVQNDGIDIDKPQNWNLEWSEKNGWQGPKLLNMAALYNVWKSPEGEEFYSYSIVTMESDKKFNWLHHRIPAILDTNAQIDAWLHEKSPKNILASLKPDTCFTHHPVSSQVNNIKNKSPGLNSAVKLEEKKLSKSAVMMTNWLKRKSTEKTTPEEKKAKFD